MRKTISTFAVIIFLIMGACGSPDPENANNYFLRGTQRGVAGDMSGAIADLNKAIELEPENAALYFARAGLYDINGDYQLAIEDTEKAIELQPDLEEGLQAQLSFLREKVNQ